MIAAPEKLDFESLREEFAAPSHCTTLAYWIGVLTDIRSKIATNAEEACAAMSHQYNVEEQDNLCGYPEYVPDIFRPIAPVTLALKWSPFPLALDIMGEPLTFDSGGYGARLFAFQPTSKKNVSPFGSADTRHFIFLLESAIRRARLDDYVLLCGSPGWSYLNADCIYRSTRRLMRDFGFVYQERKPRAGLRGVFDRYFRK